MSTIYLLKYKENIKFQVSKLLCVCSSKGSVMKPDRIHQLWELIETVPTNRILKTQQDALADLLIFEAKGLLGIEKRRRS